MSERAWTVYSPRHGYSFPAYATREEAERVASDYKRYFPDHTYIVKRDPVFTVADINPEPTA